MWNRIASCCTPARKEVNMKKGSLRTIKEYLCFGNPIFDTNEVAAIMDEAIIAVEKQTPKKPNWKYTYKERYRKRLIKDGEYEEANELDYYCPICGGVLDTFLGGDAYCKKCGQKCTGQRRADHDYSCTDYYHIRSVRSRYDTWLLYRVSTF